MTTENQLLPCPVCHGQVSRFSVWVSAAEKADVIHCPRGCKPRWNSVVVHLRSVDVPEWDDVGDAWNTMQATPDGAGGLSISFDYYPAHKKPITPDGPFNYWPRRTALIQSNRSPA